MNLAPSLARPARAAALLRGRIPAYGLPLLIAALIVLPVALLLTELLTPNVELWRRLWQTSLPAMIGNTLRLVAGVGLGTFLVGTGFAWLVTAYEFPGRALFERLLLLPLAVPKFIMGFVFIATFDYAGPVQTRWRAWFGADAWFPDIQSAGGVALVMTLVLYPYVYLLARAAFREQSATTLEAVRVMGYARWQSFLRIVLPLARPSIAAGVALTMMEALTDYGTVSFFGYPTLSEGVVRIWDGRFDRASATELAALLLLFALGMIVLERALRGSARYYQTGGRTRRLEPVRLGGAGRWLATVACALLVTAAFVLPVAQLGVWAYREYHTPTVGAWRPVYGDYIATTVRLAAMATALIMVLALVVARGVRAGMAAHAAASRRARMLPALLARVVTLGYAMPGAVIAAGVLLLLAPLDHDVTDFVNRHLGRTNPDLLLTGTTTALIYAYVVRFMAVGFNSVDASLEKIKPSMEEAARTMGARAPRILWRIQLPLVSSGLAAGALLVFVDVMKELPVTLLLRPPFGSDTLALWAYFLASEAFWQAAAIPALTILVIGLLPVLLLMRVGARERPTP